MVLTFNLWIQAGLVNGAAGTVKEIIYGEGNGMETLPETIIVHFPNYVGPQFFFADFDDRRTSRKQYPLRFRRL